MPSSLLFGAALAVTVATGPAGTAFYTPPSPLPAGNHGDVIWARPLAGGAVLPSAAGNTLVLYHTTALDGSDRVVSGMVAIPPGSPPPGGWPVISWAHGTTGDAPDCTPSLDGPGAPEHEYLGRSGRRSTSSSPPASRSCRRITRAKVRPASIRT